MQLSVPRGIPLASLAGAIPASAQEPVRVPIAALDVGECAPPAVSGSQLSWQCTSGAETYAGGLESTADAVYEVRGRFNLRSGATRTRGTGGFAGATGSFTMKCLPEGCTYEGPRAAVVRRQDVVQPQQHLRLSLMASGSVARTRGGPRRQGAGCRRLARRSARARALARRQRRPGGPLATRLIEARLLDLITRRLRRADLRECGLAATVAFGKRSNPGWLGMSLAARCWALGWILGVLVFGMAFPAPAALAADAVYWSDYGKHEISFARLDGSGGGDLATGAATLGNPIGVAIDAAADRIYWSNLTGRLSFANLDGSGGGDLQTGAATVASPYGVAIDSSAGRLYWANFAGNKLSFVNLAGSGGGDLPTLTATVNGPTGVAVDPSARRLYWASYGAGKLSFVNLDGSAGGDLPTGAATVNGPNSVAVDATAGRIYWSNYTVNTLSYANLDGSGGGDLATGAATVNGPVGIALDPSAGRIYWANHIGGGISYANLDGSGGGDLPTTGTAGGFPMFVSLLKAPTGAGAPVITGGSGPGSVLSCSSGSWAADVQPGFLSRAPASFAHGWSRNGEAIAGAVTGTYTASAGGDYRCLATASNRAGGGAQTSAPHTITGPPAPPAVTRRIDSAVQTRWGVAKTGKQFVLLRLNVTAPPSGSVVQLRCSGKRCPFGSRTFTRMRNGNIRVFRNLRLEQAQRKRVRRFRAGQRVEVRITRAGYIGRVVRYRLKQGRHPVGRGLCLAPGADKPSRCAA